MRLLFFSTALLVFLTAACSQTRPPATPSATPPAAPPPGSDVFLLAIEPGPDGSRPGMPRNLSDRPGYDNQPAFLPSGEAVLYTSIGDDGQAEIQRHDLASGVTEPVTRTAESEYSPTPIPGDDGAISVVRVEDDGKQRLWRFPLAGGAPRLLLPDLEPVGYHAWIDPDHLICFVLGTPPTLRRVKLGPGTGELLAENVGRALARIPGDGRMSFVHKRDEDRWWITAVDPASGELTPLVRTLPGREDYAWAPDGTLWAGDGGRLLVWRPGMDHWQLAADLSAHGLKDVTRLAFHPGGDLLALVAAR